MPFELLLIALAAFSLLTLLIAVPEYSINDNKTPLKILGPLVIFSGLWLTLSLTTSAERKVSTFETHTVENVDIIVNDNEVVNLNSRFRRDFEPGTKIYQHGGVSIWGVWYAPYYSTNK